jgi:hypothetical protein
MGSNRRRERKRKSKTRKERKISFINRKDVSERKKKYQERQLPRVVAVVEIILLNVS